MLHFVVITTVIFASLLHSASAMPHRPMADTLFAGYDDVLPKDLVEKVAEECKLAGSWTASSGDNFQYGKRATFWLQTDPVPKPRNYIEEAVLHLSKYALQDMYSHRDHEMILGAEWWVQIRSGTETIGFHYDKDEAMASIKSKMKHPLISTVTYLTDVGGPTLIFNQTTNGNDESPEIPDLGWISYPTKNRHITFSGDLQHGVLGSASKSGRVSQGRVTLLINWWEVQPMEPNTMELTDEHLKEIGIFESSGHPDVNVYLNDHESDSATLAFESRIDVPLSPTPTDGKRHEIIVPPGDAIYAYLPKDMNSGVHELRWKWDEIYGSIGLLDLENRNQVSSLFRLRQPKLLFLYDKKGLKGKKLHENMLAVIAPIAKTYVGSLKVYFAPTSTAKDVLGAFGISESDLPKLVIDDTVNNKKYVQDKFEVDADHITEWLHSTLPIKGLENLYK